MMPLNYPKSEGGDLPITRRCFRGSCHKCPGKWTQYPDQSGPCEHSCHKVEQPPEAMKTYNDVKPGDRIVRHGIEYTVHPRTVIIGPDIYMYARNNSDGQMYYWTTLVNGPIWIREQP